MSTVPQQEKLWADLYRGDARAFEALYREHAAAVRAFLRQYLCDMPSAQDLTQEVFLALWKNPNGFNPVRGNFRAYIFGIARKRAADWWRHHPAAEPAPQSEAAGNAEGAVVMEQALSRLEPDMRALLWLREVEGYSHTELAKILDIPLGTVKSRLFAAREALRRVWRGER